jgi:hypothetical protein
MDTTYVDYQDGVYRLTNTRVTLDSLVSATGKDIVLRRSRRRFVLTRQILCRKNASISNWRNSYTFTQSLTLYAVQRPG